MKTRERLERLDLELSRSEKLHLQEASTLLHVSEMTVRRDLRQRQPGDPLLVGGYIVSDPARRQSKSYLVTEAGKQNKGLKKNIAAYCAGMIRSGQTVFLDCGSTTEEIAHLLPEDLSVTVLCNSLNICLALCHKKNCKVYLSGGEFNPDNLLFSHSGDSPINDFRPDIAFISAAGVHKEHGVTCHNMSEVSDKRKALKNSKHKVLVCDSSKIDQSASAFVTEIEAFDTLVTDKHIGKKVGKALEGLVEILLVEG